MTCIFENFEFVGVFSDFSDSKCKIQIIHDFSVKKHGESESELKISKNTCHMRILHIFLPRKLVSFVFYIY